VLTFGLAAANREGKPSRGPVRAVQEMSTRQTFPQSLGKAGADWNRYKTIIKT
jgi:hypothetical protein